MKALLLCLAASALAGCVHAPVPVSPQPRVDTLPSPPPIHDRTVGHWINLYQGDRRLAGVSVEQFGDDPFEAQRYEGKHPEGVWFYFWDGRVRMITYSPEGAVTSDQWRQERVKAGATEWDDVDFTYGSDPKFRHHADPRPGANTRSGR